MWAIKVIVVLSAILVYFGSAYKVEYTKKCALKDGACQKEFYMYIINTIGDDGIPELDIPALDPYKLENVEILLVGMIKLTMSDGLAKGFRSCHSSKFDTDAEKLTSSIEVLCDFGSVEAKYKMESTPTLEALTGGIKVHGEGNGNSTMSKVQLNIEMPFEIKKLEDGEAYFQIISDSVTFTYKILGGATFYADNLYIGNTDVSEVAVKIMNENWKFVTNTFGYNVISTFLTLTIKYFNMYLAAVPINNIISDDVSSLITA